MIKVLAVGDNGGSSYHRINLPLKFLNKEEFKVDFVDKLEHEVVQNYDVLYLRKSNVKAATLSMWRMLFGIKIIYDRDDSFEIPKEYLNRSLLINPELKDYLIVADIVTTTTEKLRQEFLKYNPNVVVIPNRIPWGKEQFSEKRETYEQFMNRKIKVGIVGSFYHYYDWLSIKGWMNSLINNPIFKEKCEFLIGGYNKTADNVWREFKNLGTFIESKDVETYIDVYKEFDIILCPLKKNHFNECKSSLKIMEACVSNSVCVLDPLYKEKNDFVDVGFPIVKDDRDWLNIPLKIIKDKEGLWRLKNWTSIRGKRIDFNGVTKMREQVIRDVINVDQPQINNNIYTIRYSLEQPFEFIPLLNKVNSIEQKSWRFEYNVLLSHIDKVDGTKMWTGFFSWRFPQKTHLFKNKVIKILEENQKYDCINFSKPLKMPYLKFTEMVHPGFLDIFKIICKELNLPVKEPNNVIYSNFFVLKTPLYKEYIKTIIEPAIYLMENKYWDMVNKDANYNSLSKEELKNLTGLDYYNFVTFICERLIGQWIDKKKIKTLNVLI